MNIKDIVKSGVTHQSVHCQVNIKPLSVNAAWQGKRYKTPEYTKYEGLLLSILPTFKDFPKPPYTVILNWGFSNRGSDLDNPVKLVCDILQKKYGFNDKDILRMIIEKDIVKKGKEYIWFCIESYTKTE